MPPQTTDGGHRRARAGERTLLACIGCKVKKLKCDGQSPKCRNCVRLGRDCLVEDPATGLHRPRDYIRSLEGRVAFLEDLLQTVRPDVAADHLGPSSSQEQPRHAPAAGSEAGDDRDHHYQVSTPRPPVEGGVDALSNEVAMLCVRAAGHEPQYFGASSAVSFSRIASSAMRLPRRRRRSSAQAYAPLAGHQQQSSDARVDLPSPDAVAAFSRAYFTTIHPQYPFLHGPTQESMGRAFADSLVRGDLVTLGPCAVFFSLMVCAIGSLTLGHAHVPRAEGYYAMALGHIDQILDMDNLQSIQALLCCAVFSIRSQTGVSLWKVSGMAMRHCIELGYHRSAEKFRANVDVLTREMSKRCFWVAYDIDRVASIILGRPVGIQDTAIDADMPLDISDEFITTNGLLAEPRANPSEAPTSMTGALHVLRLRQLWSQFSQNLYSPHDTSATGEIEALRRRLDEWYSHVPSMTASSHAMSVFTSEKWFQLAYHYSILLLYRPYIANAGRSSSSATAAAATPSSSASALELSAKHAQSICLTYRRLYQGQGSHLQFTWGSLHILFLSGLTYLFCLWQSPDVRKLFRQTDIMQTCLACTTVLIVIAERWPEAAPYRDIFETLSERTINMMCGGGASQEGQTAATPANRVMELDLLMPGAQGTSGHETTSGDNLDPLQDWIIGLECAAAPGDPQWLAQELLDGINSNPPGTMEPGLAFTGETRE